MFWQVSDGSLYPALHKLEQEGWITAEWKRPSMVGAQNTIRLRGSGSDSSKKKQTTGQAFERHFARYQIERGVNVAWREAEVGDATGALAVHDSAAVTVVVSLGAGDQELDDELRDHLERKTAEYVAQGMTQEEAHRRARLDLGGIEQTKERCRDTRRVNWIQGFSCRICALVLRVLRKSPASLPSSSLLWPSASAPTRPSLASSNRSSGARCPFPIPSGWWTHTWSCAKNHTHWDVLP